MLSLPGVTSPKSQCFYKLPLSLAGYRTTSPERPHFHRRQPLRRGRAPLIPNSLIQFSLQQLQLQPQLRLQLHLVVVARHVGAQHHSTPLSSYFKSCARPISSLIPSHQFFLRPALLVVASSTSCPLDSLNLPRASSRPGRLLASCPSSFSILPTPSLVCLSRDVVSPEAISSSRLFGTPSCFLAAPAPLLQTLFRMLFLTAIMSPNNRTRPKLRILRASGKP